MKFAQWILLVLWVSWISSFAALGQVDESSLANLKLKRGVSLRTCAATWIESKKSNSKSCREGLLWKKAGSVLKIDEIKHLFAGDSVVVILPNSQEEYLTSSKDNYFASGYITDNKGESVRVFIPRYNDEGKANFDEEKFSSALSKQEQRFEKIALGSHKCDCSTNSIFNNLLASVKKALKQANKPIKSELRSMDELDRYFLAHQKFRGTSTRNSCDSGGGEDHQRYIRSYKAFIETAASSFPDIPPQFLGCLIFTENKWTSDESSAGAKGVAQIKDGTASDILRWIYNRQFAVELEDILKDEEKTKKLIARLNQEKISQGKKANATVASLKKQTLPYMMEFVRDNREEVHKLKKARFMLPSKIAKNSPTYRGCAAFEKVLTKNNQRWSVKIDESKIPQFKKWVRKMKYKCQKEKDFNLFVGKINSIEVTKPWFDYIEKLQNLKEYKEFRDSASNYTVGENYLNGPVKPFKQNKNNSSYPEVTSAPLAIGMAATYLNHIIDKIKDRSGRKLDPNSKKDINILLAAAGAYNAGPGSTLSNAMRDSNNDPEVWIKRIGKKSLEAKKYMNSIKNCITAGEVGGAYHGIPPKKDNPTCDVKNIVEAQ